MNLLRLGALVLAALVVHQAPHARAQVDGDGGSGRIGISPITRGPLMNPFGPGFNPAIRVLPGTGGIQWGPPSHIGPRPLGALPGGAPALGALPGGPPALGAPPGGFPPGLLPPSSTGPPRRGRSGAPPPSERRLVPDEVIVQLAGSLPQRVIDGLLRRFRLTLVDRQTFILTNTTLLRLRIPDRRSVARVVRALERDRLVAFASANYLFTLVQDAGAPDESRRDAPGSARNLGDPAQYALPKLRLPEAQALARGDRVLIAVIDSGIDTTHPDLDGVVTSQFDALGSDEPPHAHGTAIAGVIAAHGRLLGAAPAARIAAVRAFGAAPSGAEGTTFNILKGLDWAAVQGARIINLSFAGPSDPLLARALAALHRRGTIVIAAVGNAGPRSPPLYPAADATVIAVTATDPEDRLFAQANRGPHVTVAAPGVDILAPAPGGAYQAQSGTSFAAAYVSGIVALLIERRPRLNGEVAKRVLQQSAKDLGPRGRDEQFGAGLADAHSAILSLPTDSPGAARAR